ncbi:MAG: WhiB family transcriptional regulator [Egibacteraceae bacterium]
MLLIPAPVRGATAERVQAVELAVERPVPNDGLDVEVRGPVEVGLLTVAQVLASLTTGLPGWERLAACASGEYDPDLWWPERGDNGLPARQVCAGCPVLGDCRDYFLSTPGMAPAGIWAGVGGDALVRAVRWHLRRKGGEVGRGRVRVAVQPTVARGCGVGGGEAAQGMRGGSASQ